MNWKVPSDYIDRQDNLINDIFEDEDCPPNLPNILEGMQAISFGNNEVTLHAKHPEQLKEEVYQNDKEWNESINTVDIPERDIGGCQAVFFWSQEAAQPFPFLVLLNCNLVIFFCMIFPTFLFNCLNWSLSYYRDT